MGSFDGLIILQKGASILKNVLSHNKKSRKLNAVWPYLLLLPALLFVLFVVAYPIFVAFRLSFMDYDLTRLYKSQFIGFDNYASILFGSSSKRFFNSLMRTIEWVFFGVGGQFLFGFCLALLLNQYFKGRGIVRSLSLIPWVTPGVLIALMWSWIFDGNFGVFNDLLLRAGIINEKIAFLANKQTAMPSVVTTIVWQGIPFFALMILAGLQNISHDLYEAADIDGASAWKKLMYITIPSLRNTIFVTTMLRIIWVTNSVDVIFNMTNGGPANATRTLSVYIYQEASKLNMGYASSMAIVLSLLLMVVTIPYVKNSFSSLEK